jgi:hypothetical protein
MDNLFALEINLKHNKEYKQTYTGMAQAQLNRYLLYKLPADQRSSFTMRMAMVEITSHSCQLAD